MSTSRKPDLMPSSAPVIVWFREDLRLADNPALAAAAGSGRAIVFVYIRETDCARPAGGASRWWLNKSLKALAGDLSERGAALVLRTGQAAAVLEQLARETGADQVFWNRRYAEEDRTRDAAIKADFASKGIACHTFNARLLVEPWTLKTASGGYYRVFTPFWRALRASYKAPDYLPAPARLASAGADSEPLDTWKLHPRAPDWSAGLEESWQPGEQGAVRRLDAFLSGPINTYGADRNFPWQENGTSRLSPHLRFGEIGPAQIWRAVSARVGAGEADEASALVFLSEIAWREFSYTLLFFNPGLGRKNYNPKFDRMAWKTDPVLLSAWQRGQTGFPIVDAGMRELWHTGWMHNRVRMITASFLTKHLLQPWQEGEAWFWDTLVDADPAANAASWQWTAGSGADAAPYFRVFNPISQGGKFDTSGSYVRRWCPELARLPDKVLHAPFEADRQTLARAGVRLADTYPEPIITHGEGRQRALDAYKALKEEEHTQ